MVFIFKGSYEVNHERRIDLFKNFFLGLWDSKVNSNTQHGRYLLELCSQGVLQ